MQAAKRTQASSGAAVLLVDVINKFEFPGAGPLIRSATRAVPSIEHLLANARGRSVPIVYVNDNFGQWTSDFRNTINECARPTSAGSLISQRLRPQKGDYFVLKPQHSGFYGTPLALLLEHLGVGTLILAGFAANLCVLFTANDAHMRGFHIVVPRDCVASNSTSLTRSTLIHVRDALGGTTPLARSVDFERMRTAKRKPRGQTF